MSDTGDLADRDGGGPADRREQLNYSETMAKMLDETARRKKAAKIVAVVSHALGVESLDALRAVDVGCSAGFIADELALAGATTSGVDIDEPGLARARERFGDRVDFRVARGEDLPFDDDSVDVVVLNHIYEHVVDPEAVVADIHRVLRPGGLLYLGVGHRWQLIEPHHRLPFLSWLPRRAADRYVRLAGRGDHYYERYYTPLGSASSLRRLRRLGLHASGPRRPAGVLRRRQRPGVGGEGAAGGVGRRVAARADLRVGGVQGPGDPCRAAAVRPAPAPRAMTGQPRP